VQHVADEAKFRHLYAAEKNSCCTVAKILEIRPRYLVFSAIRFPWTRVESP